MGTARRVFFSIGVNVSTAEFENFKERISHLGSGSITLSKNETGKLARIELDNPESRNAMSGVMMAQLHDIVHQLEKSEDCVALILTGKGSKAFCSGADLSLARDHLKTPDDGRLMCTLMTESLNRMKNLPIISVAAIEGAAIGGGAELATSCDFRVFSSHAKIQFIHAKMGVSPGWGGGARLTKILGARKALKVLAWAEALSAQDALRLGLADEVAAESSTAEAAAVKMLEQVLTQPNTSALRAVKTTIAAADAIQDDAITVEKHSFFSVWGGSANRAALEMYDVMTLAVLEKK